MRGWRLSIGIGVGLLVLYASMLASWGADEAALRRLVLWTARCAAALFVIAFGASSAHTLLGSDGTAAVLRNRRYLGVSFAIAHQLHLAAVVGWLSVTGEPQPALLYILGVPGFVLSALMGATSTDRAVRWLGPRRWKALHGTSGYYLWAVFTLTYLGRLGDGASQAALPFIIFLTLGALRLLAWRRRQRITTPVQ